MSLATAAAFTMTLACAVVALSGANTPAVAASAGGVTRVGLGLPKKKTQYGFAAGNFVIQPRFLVEGTYTTNFFRVDDRTAGAEELGVFSLHLKPGFAIFNPNPNKVALMFGVDANAQLPFSGDEGVSDQRDVGVDANATVTFFPKSAFSLILSEAFQRSLWARPTGTDRNADRNQNQLGADIRFAPGGRALSVETGYRWQIQRFDSLSELNTDQHQLRFKTAWRFYPLTTAFLEADWRISEYKGSPSDAEVANAGNFVPGKPLKVYLGLAGYITERIALLAKAGYGNSFLARDSEDFSSAIGQLKLTFKFSSRTAFHIGGSRDFELAPLGGYYDFVRALAALDQGIGDVMIFHLDFSLDKRRFGLWEPAPVTDANGNVTRLGASDEHRSDIVLRGGVLLEFDLTRVLGASLGYRYESDVTDFVVSRGTIETFQGYDEHRVFGSINLRY